MKPDEIKVHREVQTIEGNRNLYLYSFTDREGHPLAPQPAHPTPAGNLASSGPAEDRKE